jgi:VanZ family protein
VISLGPNSVPARIVAWMLAVVIAILSVVPPDLRPETGVPHYFEHFLVYAVMGAAFAFGYERNPNLLAGFLVAYCAIIEIVQLFVSGRHARLFDFATDAVATGIGLSVTLVAKLFYNHST